MPEPTIQELAARVAALEQLVGFLETLPPRPAPDPTDPPPDLTTRVSTLERQVARLWSVRQPRPLPQMQPASTYENLVGSGADLWDSDEELDEFLARIREGRQRPGG